MKPTREQAWLGFGLLLAALAAVWLFFNTEWVEVKMPRPHRGEAATDPLYAAKRLVTELGGRVTSPDGLERLPPAGATLVLSAFYGNLFPERRQALRGWVEAGGHLVVPSWFVGDEDEDLGWLPMHRAERPNPPANDDEEDEGDTPAPAERKPPRPCPDYLEPDSVAPAFGARRSYRLCGHFGILLESDRPAHWALDDRNGHVWLRTALGRGSVTAIGGYDTFQIERVLEDDHGLALVAALQLRPGADVWFVRSEERPALLVVIWRTGAPVVLLCALALALWLWRGALRFGPPVAEPSRARRSVAEQVRGTAGFIFRRGGGALHRASVRALEEPAARHLPAALLRDPARRIETIARAGGVDAAALKRAMDTGRTPSRHELPSLLALLESARRRLAARHRSSN